MKMVGFQVVKLKIVDKHFSIFVNNYMKIILNLEMKQEK
jgi:hypothetical protein